jgi:hypothetical protein
MSLGELSSLLIRSLKSTNAKAFNCMYGCWQKTSNFFKITKDPSTIWVALNSTISMIQMNLTTKPRHYPNTGSRTASPQIKFLYEKPRRRIKRKTFHALKNSMKSQRLLFYWVIKKIHIGSGYVWYVLNFSPFRWKNIEVWIRIPLIVIGYTDENTK